MKRLDQLTFTRFWALLLVIFYHGGGGIFIQAINFFPFSPILYSAPSAVSYLYVLSGFVMAVVYYRPREKFDVPGYWTARIARIYPLYILSFLLVCYYYLDYIARIKPLKVVVNIFVLQAWWPPYAQSFNYASWSMTVEFFFYAVFPFFTMWAYKTSTKRLIWISLGLWVFTQVIHYILWIGFFPAWELFIVYNPIFHLNSFILGVVGGIWFLRESRIQVNQRLNLFVIFLSLALICVYTVLSDVVPGMPRNLQPMSGLLAPLFTLFIVSLALDKTRLSSILSHRWLVVLGETAFAMYILHVPVIWLYERALFSWGLADPEFVLSLTYLPMMISVGLVSFFFIDPPIRRWMKQIMSRISMPLMILDLALFSLSVFLSFKLRFGDGREYNSYRTSMLLMFWSAFLFRTVVSIVFKGLIPGLLHASPLRFLKTPLITVSVGSIVVAGLVYAGFRAGWIENFPRSIFVIDWAIVLVFSLAARYIFRRFGVYRPKPVLGPAPESKAAVP